MSHLRLLSAYVALVQRLISVVKVALLSMAWSTVYRWKKVLLSIESPKFLCSAQPHLVLHLDVLRDK